jgi:hypothetical protein
MFKGIYYHLIPLFCTVPANQGLATELQVKISNEINDLAWELQACAG